MSPVVQDPWEAAWPTRRSVAPAGDDANKENEGKEAPEEEEAALAPAVAPAPAHFLPHSSSGAAVPPASRARSTSPGRVVIPPAISSEAKGTQAPFAVGDDVEYWSSTHQQWMSTQVKHVNVDPRGVLTGYDLDVKRGAQASKIRSKVTAASDDLRPLPEQQSNKLLPPSMVQKVPTPVSNTATGQSELASAGDSSTPLNSYTPERHPGGASPPIAAPTAPAAQAVPSQVPTPSAVPLKLSLALGGAAPIGTFANSSAAGLNAPVPAEYREEPPEELSKDGVLALRSFQAQESVEYWSSTYSQWMQARVEKVRTDNVTYDLDVKRGAQRRKMRTPRRPSKTAGVDMPSSVPGVPPATSGRAADALATQALAPTPSLSAVRAQSIETTSPAPALPSLSAAPRAGAATAGVPGNGLGLPGTTGANAPQVFTTLAESAPPGMPSRNMRPDSTTSSRLRALSRETVKADEEDVPKLSMAPEKIAAPGGYPRSGSPLLGDKTMPDKPGSQCAPVGDLSSAGDGRPRLFSGAGGMLGRGRQDLGRPGPVASGSVGLAAGGGDGMRPAPTLSSLTPGGLLNANAKATRRLLPDSSAGPNIGTRPDTAHGTGVSATAGPGGPLGFRTGASQVPGTGHVTVNGVLKKAGPNGFVPGGTGGADKVVGPSHNGNLGGLENKMMQREGDKFVVRQLPGTAAPFNPVYSSTPSTSSHRPPASSANATLTSVMPPGASATTPGKAPEETAANGDGDGLECLATASPAELALLARQLAAEPDDLDLTTPLNAPKAQEGFADSRTGTWNQRVVAALGRLSMRDLSRRLAEVPVDSSILKDRRDLEALLVQTMLARLRAPPFPPLAPDPAQAPIAPERCRGVPPASTAAPAGISAAADSCASVLVATGLSGISVHHKPQLEVGELDIGSGSFDPREKSMHAQIASLLGVSMNSSMEEMTGFRGGLNEGVWFLNDHAQSPPPKELVLKLVKCTRISPRILTEAENFVKMYSQHPKIAYDPAVAFPVRIFKCHGPAPEKHHRYDLIVMWKVRGERLAELIAHKWYQKSFDELWQIFERLGENLASFHLRYNESQHGDFQPSNVFYEEDTAAISLIDIGGMGVPTSESDVEHFSKSLKLLSDVYGDPLVLKGHQSLETGYAAGMRAR